MYNEDRDLRKEVVSVHPNAEIMDQNEELQEKKKKNNSNNFNINKWNNINW